MSADRPANVAAASEEDFGLPAWTYDDRDFFDAEKARIFAASWQVVCHQSDVAAPGAWHALEFLGESVIVVRGDDGAIRAFSNVCRHRGSRILDGHKGCVRRFTCPYHAWTYALDGRLVGVPMREDYPSLDMARESLSPVDIENWRGFLFVRLVCEGPSVAEMMAPYEDQVAPYRFEDLRALGRITLRPRNVNWKNVADNYSDGLHIPVAHPGLTRLFGRSYGVEAEAHVDRMWGDLVDTPSVNLSERAYQRFLPEAEHLPQSQRRRWLYFKIWPNVAFDIYPDQVDFMQFLPVSPTETLIREISYCLPDSRREMRAARYLNWRINRRVNSEDTALIARVQKGMASQSFVAGPLARQEVCLRSFGKKMRSAIPESRHSLRPSPGWFKPRT